MNRLILSFTIALISIIPFSTTSASAAEKVVGLRSGYVTRHNTASAGLYLSYRFTEHFRFSPKIDYAFKHEGTDAFSFNFDTEYPLALNASKSVNFYPVAGLNWSTYNIHTTINDTDVDDSIDSSERESHFGLNLGAGIEYFATPTLRLSFESKCLLMKKNTGGWFTLAIGYRF